MKKEQNNEVMVKNMQHALEGSIWDRIAYVNETLAPSLMNIGKITQMITADVEADRNNMHLYLDNCPMLDNVMMARMLLMGKGVIRQELMFVSVGIFKTLAKYPVTIQEKLLNEGIDMVDGDTFFRMPLQEMKPKDIKQAFSAEGVRTPAQQKAYLAEKAFRNDYSNEMPCEGSLRIIVKNSKAYAEINKHVILSESQLKKLLKDMSCAKKV